MSRPKLNPARMGACALAMMVLAGCGGSHLDETPASAQDAVQMTQSDSKVAVTATVPSAGTQAPAAVQWAATTTAGAAAPWSGLLILRSESEDGATELEGRLVPGAAVNGVPAASPAAALLAELRERIDTLRTAFAATLDTARKKLQADLAAATTDAERQAARAAFSAAFKALFEKLKQDVAAVAASYADRLAALGIKNPLAALRGEDGERGEERSGGRRGPRTFEVEGTVAAAGAVTLRIELADGAVVEAVGTMAADGSMSGTYKGPAATDAGKWSATTGSTTAPPPAPAASSPPPASSPPASSPPPAAPPPAGNATAGAMKYATACASCHDADPRANVANVRKATSVAALDAAIAKVRDMRGLATILSAQDKLDIVAFVIK